MEDVIQYGSSLVANGEPFKVDFHEQTIRVGGQDLIKIVDNKTESNIVLSKITKSDYALPPMVSLQEALQTLESLYITYKHSRPKTDEPSQTYFKALKYKDLSNEDKDFGVRRQDARFLLEATLLCYVLNGSLYWDEKVMGNGWFYKGKNDHDFIILRSWIEPSNI